MLHTHVDSKIEENIDIFLQVPNFEKVNYVITYKLLNIFHLKSCLPLAKIAHKNKYEDFQTKKCFKY